MYDLLNKLQMLSVVIAEDVRLSGCVRGAMPMVERGSALVLFGTCTWVTSPPILPLAHEESIIPRVSSVNLQYWQYSLLKVRDTFTAKL